MHFSEAYFKGEYREGFFVRSMMKRAWAAQIEVLEVVKAICEKHHITYYADFGTLLGTIRHGGFIPWDDDLDICMKREDYYRFLSVAQNEFPEGFQMLSTHTTEGFTDNLIRVVNSGGINLNPGFMNVFHGCPFSVGIDIFALDYLPREDEKLFELKNTIEQLQKFISILEHMDSSEETVNAIKEVVCENFGYVFHDRLSVIQQLRSLIEQFFGSFSDEESDDLGDIVCYLEGHPVTRIPKECYDNIIMKPFENTFIAVPAEFDHVLAVKYGDYHTYKKGTAGHSYPFYQDQQEILREYVEKNLIDIMEEQTYLLRDNVVVEQMEYYTRRMAAMSA